jgi:hypothetical protein
VWSTKPSQLMLNVRLLHSVPRARAGTYGNSEVPRARAGTYGNSEVPRARAGIYGNRFAAGCLAGLARSSNCHRNS